MNMEFMLKNKCECLSFKKICLMNLFIFPRNAQCCLTLASRASVNILQSGVRTSVVLNLDVRYALAIKSDVTLDAGRKKNNF